MKKIVTIGGGSGSFAILRGLKEHDLDITAVVNIFDSGGSSGVLRDEIGVLPPGDTRRAILALSEGEQTEILRALFSFRFNGGTGLAGHNFGNLLLVALSALYGGDAEAIEKASELLNIKGIVYPVSLDKSHVHAILEDGTEIIGETNIDIPKHDSRLRITKVFLDPPARLYTKADTAIRAADVIVVCPGDLYSSLAPTLLTDGMKEAISASSARLVWACNMMTKMGETNGFSASDFARELVSLCGRRRFDAVIVNTGAVARDVLAQYAHERQYPVLLDETNLRQYADRIITGDLLSDTDLVRLDSAKVARVIAGL